MTELKNLRFSFLVIAFLICSLVVMPFDFFVQLKISIPFWSFYLLEICFVFLILFAAFPKASISSIIKISVVFMIFMSFCYMLQGFLPIHSDHKVLALDLNEDISSLKIVINILGILALHIVASFLFASELLRKEKDLENKTERGSTLQYQREVNIDQEYSNQENSFIEDSAEEINLDYKENLSSLFDIYLDDYENNPNKIQQKLGNMESILLNNLKEGVTGAMCLNADGEELHDQIFHWQGFNKYELIELYKANDKLSANLNEGALCQMLFCDQNHWYLVAKYRGNYLLLQTDDIKPDLLIENSFYLVQAIRQFA